MVSWCLSTMVGVMIKILLLRVEESPHILVQKKNLESKKALAQEPFPFMKLQYLKSNNINQTFFAWTKDILYCGEIMTHQELSYYQSSTECVLEKLTVRAKKTSNYGSSESLSYFYTIRRDSILSHLIIVLSSLSLKLCTFKSILKSKR